MKLLVALKRVPDPAWAVHLDAAGNLDTAQAPWVMNPYDEIALAAALRLKETGAAHELLAVTCGPAGCLDILRTALALGADRAHHIASETAPEPLTTARLLAALIRREAIDLVLLGKQASDSDAGLTGPLLAGLLGWPQATAVIALQREEDSLIACEQREHSTIRLRLCLPAVITTDLRLDQPRYASLPNLLRARRMPIASTTAAELAIDPTPSLQTLQRKPPPPRPAGVRVRDVSELIARLEAAGIRQLAAGGTLTHPADAPPFTPHPPRPTVLTELTFAPPGLDPNPPSPRPLLILTAPHPLTTDPRPLITAGRTFAPRVDLLLAGETAAAHQAAQLAGVERVLHIAGEAADDIAALAHLIAQLHAQRRYSHILAPAQASGRAIIGRLGGLLQQQPVHDVLAIPAADTFIQPHHAGTLHAHVRTTAPCTLLTVRCGHFAAVGRRSGPPAHIESHTLSETDQRAQIIDRTATAGSELVSARIVIAGGRGLGTKANFDRLLAPLAAALGGALAATRSAVEAGIAPAERLVGQSGQRIAPALYLAVGVSGAVQHLAGIDGQALIVAIDKDAEAPIHRIADLSLVADLFTAVPELLARWSR